MGHPHSKPGGGSHAARRTHLLKPGVNAFAHLPPGSSVKDYKQRLATSEGSHSLYFPQAGLKVGLLTAIRFKHQLRPPHERLRLHAGGGQCAATVTPFHCHMTCVHVPPTSVPLRCTHIHVGQVRVCLPARTVPWCA